MAIVNLVWDYVVPFLVILTILVYVHEMGHYLLAKRNGVRIEVFSIGFGPEIYGWTNKVGTRWKISAIPLGGYVKMFGESDFAQEEEDKAREMTAEERAVSFHHKKLGQRAAIVAAGPIANFLFSIVLLTCLFSVLGNPRALSGVGTVQADSAAAAAGLTPGDVIVSVDNQPVKWFDDLREIVGARADKQITIDIQRDGKPVTLTATPRASERTDEQGNKITTGLLGITPDPNQVAYERQNPIAAAGKAIDYTATLCGRILGYLGEVITGSRGAEELGGPLRIAQISGEMAQGGFASMLSFLAALSINLGLLNLFPIPMLDGGHLAYYLAEAILGRPLGPRAQEYGFRFGLILVFMLMIFATWNDLVHLKVIEFIRGLIT
jgi:regulator of sigma E protease